MSSAWMEFKAEVIARITSRRTWRIRPWGVWTMPGFFARLNEGEDQHTNSLAILVKHISGNYISRWTDFLTTDGEKADRQRPREFMQGEDDDRTQIMQRWEEGWRIVFATLDLLIEEDFGKTVYIRGEAHTVVKAILRNLLHAAHHIGQIDLMASVLSPEVEG